MKRVGTEDGLYHFGNPAIGEKGTPVTDFFNDVQEEVCNVITAAGIALDGTRRDQLFAAIATIAKGKGLVLTPDDVITKGPRVDVRTFMDGANGRPTLAAWKASPQTVGVAAVFNAAHVYAASIKGVVYAPGGEYLIESTITYKAPMIGDGELNTLLYPGITDGTPVISIASPTVTSFWLLRDFTIRTLSGNIQNFKGIYSNYVTHWYMENVYVRSAALGYHLINSWIGYAVNCAARMGTKGLLGSALNAVELNMIIEGNVDGIDLVDSAGVQIKGGVHENNSGTALFLSKCKGITIDSYYEANGTHMNVGYEAGDANRCRNIAVTGGNYVTSFLGGIKVNNVDYFELAPTAYFASSALWIGAEARQYKIPPSLFGNLGAGTINMVDLTRYATTPERRYVDNLFPNPKFFGFNGWKRLRAIASTGTLPTITLETAPEGNSIKVEHVAGSNFTRAEFQLPDSVANFMKGKTMLITALIFVSNTADYVHDYDNGASNPTCMPQISISTVGGAAPIESNLGTFYGAAGYWYRMANYLTIPADSTEVWVRAHSNRTNRMATVTGHVKFKDIVVCEMPTSLESAYRGYNISPIAGRYAGSRWVGSVPAPPTIASLQTFTIGDRLENDGSVTSINDNPAWIRMTDGTAHVIGTDWIPARLTGVTGAIGGGALAAGASTTGTVNIPGAVVGMAVSVSPTANPGDGAVWTAYVSAPGVVTVVVTATKAMTPTATSYNVRLLQ